MFFGDFFEEHVQRANPRLDCAGRSETWVGPSRKSLEIEEKTEVLLMQLHALTFSSKCARKGPPKGSLWGPLGLLLSLWRPTWSPKGAQSCEKGRPNEALESAQATRRPECYPNAVQGCPGPRKWSPQGPQMVPFWKSLSDSGHLHSKVMQTLK